MILLYMNEQITSVPIPKVRHALVNFGIGRTLAVYNSSAVFWI
jgi:hypothetical protein